MKDSGLPPDVQRFLAQHIDSVEQLEVLLLLQRTAPRDWSSAEVAAELRVAALSVETRLDGLQARGFATRAQDRYHYEQATGTAEVLRRVADAYRERRVAVISYIFNKPDNNLRALADAFKVK